MLMDIDFKALVQVKACKDKLSPHQYRTLRGQIFSGNSEGAMKGLRKILRKGQNNGCRNADS
nr:MAG TPA: hypothetical protein [Caudoviricetes sp.]